MSKNTDTPHTRQAALALDLDIASTAVVSDCGRYRYRLDRKVDASKQGRVCWVMLNPSTADAIADDPTLRRCIAYTRAWQHGSLVVVNLFAWRATDPRSLPLDIETAVGPLAGGHIGQALRESSIVICGWGSSGPRERVSSRVAEVLGMIRSSGHEPFALGLTKYGHPRHPLYMRGDATPVSWSAHAIEAGS